LIRFRFDDRAESVGFALSPLSEAISSLHVLLFPKAHAVQHPWIRAMRRVSPALRREIRAWAFLYEDAQPDCFLPPAIDATISFQEHLDVVRALPLEQARYELARPLFHYHVPQAGGPDQLDDEGLRTQILDWAAGAPGGGGPAVLVLDDPEAAVRGVVNLLERYWEEAFADEWARLEPELESAVEECRTAVADEGVVELLGRQPGLLRDGEGIVRRSPHEHTVEIGPGRRLMLVPSAYVWPHSRVNCDDPWPLAILHPAPFVLREAARRPAPPELVASLRAAGDTTRLAILRRCAERPRTTEELAPLVSLSEPALSRQLRILVEGGLLTARRDGYYVLYALDGEAVERVGSELAGFLSGPARSS
jgi:DNA-binding transcriptional ArsR family regulator